jgi:AbrB family looped-hinge helix DNA binding protein
MKTARCQVSKSGRLSLPAAFRRALGLEQGGPVIVELDDDAIRIVTQRQAIARAQVLYKRALNGAKGMSVDEFIAERHREAEREEAEYREHAERK